MSEKRVIVLNAGEGEMIDGLSFKATGADGLGHFSFAEETLAPGARPDRRCTSMTRTMKRSTSSAAS
jgi:hypothetical protein